MADSVELVDAKHPLPAFRYLVRIGEDVMAFRSVSGLELSYSEMEYRDGLGGWFQVPGIGQGVDVTLSDGTCKDAPRLYDWISSVVPDGVRRRDISISLTNESGDELYVTWNVLNAFPVRLTAPGAAAAAGTSADSEITVEELNLRADRVVMVAH